MASALFSSRRSSCCPLAAKAANRNKTSTSCLTLGLIFVTPPRFSRPAQQKIDPALDVRILVLFKMQLRDMPELQSGSQFLPQVPRSVFQGRERVVAPALVAAQGHFDGGVPGIRAHLDRSEEHTSEARIFHLEADDLIEFFFHRLPGPQQILGVPLKKKKKTHQKTREDK